MGALKVMEWAARGRLFTAPDPAAADPGQAAPLAYPPEFRHYSLGEDLLPTPRRGLRVGGS